MRRPAPALNSPYGGPLVDLIVGDDRAAEMKATAKDLASLTLDERGLCDLELLAVGGFSPLKSFLGKADYERVVAEMRLADGTLWPLARHPAGHARRRRRRGEAAGPARRLRQPAGVPPRRGDLRLRQGRTRPGAPTARPTPSTPRSPTSTGSPATTPSGRLEVIRVPPHYDFVELRRTPAELRDHFQSLGWSKIVAFQTRNPLHRAHEELTKRAAEQIGGGLLIHPVVGVTKPGDVDHYTRVRCYRALVDNYYEPGSRGPQPAAAGDAHGRARARCCCTRSSAATTAAPTSSSAATTPGRATTRPASRSTRPMPPRSRWASTRTRSAWRWSTSSRWSTCPTRTATARSTRSRRASRRPTSPAPRSATTTWPRASSSPSGSAGRPWPRSSTRPARPSSARA